MQAAVVLPLIAGILHLHVFYHATFNFILTSFDDNFDNQPFYNSAYHLERSVFIAYVFDLLCCYIFNIVPFSRCHSYDEVSKHHLPILLLLFPLGIPVWAELTHIDPMIHGIIGTDTFVTSTTGSTDNLRLIALDKMRIVEGWAYFSSLNELVQRVAGVGLLFSGLQGILKTSIHYCLQLACDRPQLLTLVQNT